MKFFAWLVGMFIALRLFMSAMSNGNDGLAMIVLVVTLLVLGPYFFRAKQRALDRGLGTKNAKDGMDRTK